MVDISIIFLYVYQRDPIGLCGYSDEPGKYPLPSGNLLQFAIENGPFIDSFCYWTW